MSATLIATDALEQTSLVFKVKQPTDNGLHCLDLRIFLSSFILVLQETKAMACPVGQQLPLSTC